MTNYTIETELTKTIKTLSERLWEGRAQQPDLDRWLSNFDGSCDAEAVERLHALHLLAHLNYYGLRELRVLLRSVYRDLFRYPMVDKLRTLLGPTAATHEILAAFQRELEATRFVGMGNPAESGTHLLYYFRQENELPKDLFISPHQLFSGPLGDPATDLADPSIQHIVFLDDLLGSGQQATEYSSTLLADIRDVATRNGRSVTTYYFVLFARTTGLGVARQSLFDVVEAVHEMDETYKAFDASSRVYADPPAGVSRQIGETVCHHYGSALWPAHPLGYRDGQMLLGFHHNIPDNTLPVIWHDRPSSPWQPVFSRYAKV